ncbi:hypothetical protein TraAM80_05244 [Trypanosoma rangeli]|uniref:Uncharacterized protein n=1 Tax=Trypanosoma rangeli TaxID=5698 RepID=A0A422NFY5_TRYRA|nr:uncharacterized protein TraAM80_05244 [Trypanosoma rangeli]RNF04349.1 hypothetical protein TraAM80_05244 [Trypanosoma rangeli]|eukprot:RNF04349.1 hypothetical protein TraAM80_05244 [Trypanosoma rangeli]
MLALRSRNEFERVGEDCISCTICPAMKTIIIPISCLAFELRELLSIFLDLDVESIELYRKGSNSFISVPDVSLGVGHYYVLLRIRGGKGGFRKQLEKKGRAFARARRLREINPGGVCPRPERGDKLVLGKNAESNESEINEKSPAGEKEIQPNNIRTDKIREAVRIGVKRTIEGLLCSET